MLKTKSCKIILGVLAMVMFIGAFVCGINVKKASAAEVGYLTLDKVNLNEDEVNNLEFSVEEGGSITFTNALVLNELAIEGKLVGANATLTFNTKSSDVNKEDVEHKVELTAGANMKFDGVESATALTETFKVYFKVEDFKVSASLDNANYVSKEDAKSFNQDKCIANSVKITFTDVTDGAKFNLISVDQDYNDATGVYKQTFERDAETGNLKKKASARLSLNETKNLFVLGENGYTAQALLGIQYNLTVKAYSPVGQDISSVYYISEEGLVDTWISKETNPKGIMFRTVGEKTFTVQNKDKNSFETFKLNVVDGLNDETAPVYINDADAIASYKTALEKATKITEDEKTYSIRLGEEVELPSLQNLVKDDFNAYSDLTYKVYYNTPSSKGKTSSTMSIKVEEAGEYSFYVVFTDKLGNAQEKEYFVDEDAETAPKYEGYVFSFEIEDDAPIVIEAINQSGGYVGSRYTSSEFTVKYSGYTPSYELYYNANVDAEVGDLSGAGWVKIPARSTVDEDDNFENGLTYDRIKKIAYDGNLTFTPDAIGKYVIKCTVTSQMSIRSAEKCNEIKVEKTLTTVKPVSTWLQDNVWSVVFLGVGTLCLAGIVVLLCIKPKAKKED